MKDQTIHINIDLYKSDDKYIVVSKTRLWSYIPPTLLWLIKVPKPRTVAVESCSNFIIINNLAILIEGFITDLLIDFYSKEDINSDQIRNLDNSSWETKRKKFEKTFNQSLNKFKQFQSIEILFALRNNFSHGKTYSEMSTREIQSGIETVPESQSHNYERSRKFLIEKCLIPKESKSLNDPFWRTNVSMFFFLETKRFLFDIIESVEIKGKDGILSELKTAFQDYH